MTCSGIWLMVQLLVGPAETTLPENPVTECRPLLPLGCRQVVKSDSATVTIPELDFEIPAATQKGSITTVEGLLSDASDNLK